MRAGTVLIFVGAAVLILGLVLRYAPWLVSWFGKLPGDIRIEGENARVFIPVTSMIIISVMVSVTLALLSRFRG